MRDNGSILLTICDKDYKDVKDKLNDLIPWAERLLNTLTKANIDNDPEELDRRTQLATFVSCSEYLVHWKLILHRSSLEKIGARAESLSKKGIFVGVLDKAKDSAEVVALVEELRQAILVYQVGVGEYWGQRVLTRRTDVATAVDLQPSCSVDCESPSCFSCSTPRLSRCTVVTRLPSILF